MRPLATEPRVLGVSDEEMATIYRCGCCGAYWASGYQYPHEIPPSRARALFPNLEELERKARLY
jgi:ubiquitin